MEPRNQWPKINGVSLGLMPPAWPEIFLTPVIPGDFGAHLGLTWLVLYTQDGPTNLTGILEAFPVGVGPGIPLGLAGEKDQGIKKMPKMPETRPNYSDPTRVFGPQKGSWGFGNSPYFRVSQWLVKYYYLARIIAFYRYFSLEEQKEQDTSPTHKVLKQTRNLLFLP